MPPFPPEENQDSADAPPPPSASHPRIRTRTPEQRRFLNTPRAVPPNEPSRTEEPESLPESTTEPEKPEAVTPSTTARKHKLERPPFASKRKESLVRSTELLEQTKGSREAELRQAFLIISALVMLFGVFFAGLKFEAIKHQLVSRLTGPDLGKSTNRFPGVSSDDLVETGLAAERQGRWQEAADRFLEAKRQNRQLPGVLFRIGKNAFDRGEIDGADTALDRAIKSGENLAPANYYRGLIAMRRRDLPAATRFFEAAASAEPFNPDYYFSWAEALRLDHHPRDAMRRYQQAIQRTSSAQDATLCQFKIRLARTEAAEASKVREEVEAQRRAGALSVDWLMTDAALQLQAGNMAETARLISEAREKGGGLFAGCAGDPIFRQAAEKNPELAALIGPAVEKPLQNR